MWSSPRTIYIDQNLHDEDIQRTMISTRLKIDQDLHSGWKCLTYTGTSHESWNLMNTGMIKEVAYSGCHQSGRSSTHTAMSTCPTMRIEVSRSNIVVHCLITGHWCLLLIDTRSPIDNDNGNQGTECNITSVNRCVEVEHLEESIDQGTLMYSQNCQWWENLPLMTVNLKELKWL